MQNKTSTYIVWILQDNRDPGVYRILVNNTPWDLGWQQWVNNSELEILVNTNLGLGDWNYTIQYRDLAGYWGIEDNVIVTIEKVLDNNIYENNENTDNSLHQDESHWLKFLTNPIYLGGIILFGIGGIVIIFVKKRK